MSKERVTIDHVYGGQPRAYADSIYITRVFFEHVNSWAPIERKDTGEDMQRGEWEPWDMDEKYIRERLLGLKCGFTEFDYSGSDHSMSAYFTLRLVYLKKLAPGLWEFKTLSAFTD